MPTTSAHTERILEAFARDEDAIHVDGEAVTVSIADRVSLGEVARRLDDEGIVMDELALRRPSLDEVFLAITGHVAEADELGATPKRNGGRHERHSR